ncbi:MAG: methionine--tRNA ligase [Patescibacteria group bacterium]
MKESKIPFYITTALPYVNAEPHIGHATEMVRADIIARFKRLSGRDVFFNVGTDEHGQKVYTKAVEAGRDPKEYVDEYAERFKSLAESLSISYDHFTRTTDPLHITAVQKFWKMCSERGFIYKKTYKGLYCVSDEMFITQKDIINGRCPDHPNSELVSFEEENYFFKFSAFENGLLSLYQTKPELVVPPGRLNEIKSFVKRGLEDFSISRLKEKMPWGIAVPGDPSQVMYVWFDALVNYISSIGWPDSSSFKRFWVESGGVVQYCGKDNLRQQAAIWQAMLLSTGLPPSRQIVIDGFILTAGEKMSKSVGNVVNPVDLIKIYGADALRFYIARDMHPFEDSDFTLEKFRESYNGNLANGLGNLVSRLLSMTSRYDVLFKTPWPSTFPEHYTSFLDRYEINKAAEVIWHEIAELDRDIQKNEPFKTIKTDEAKTKVFLNGCLSRLATIAFLLQPFLPDTAQKIKELIEKNIPPATPLFPRKDES